MWRRLALLVVPVLAATVVGARVADGGSGSARAVQYTLPEPAVTSSSSLRLPELNRCVRRTYVRVGLVPPPNVVFASLSVRVGVEEILQLASLGGPGTVVVTLPPGRSRVRVTGTTSGGQFLSAAKTYRRCGTTAKKKVATPPKPKRRPRPEPTPVVQGGGQD